MINDRRDTITMVSGVTLTPNCFLYSNGHENNAIADDATHKSSSTALSRVLGGLKCYLSALCRGFLASSWIVSSSRRSMFECVASKFALSLRWCAHSGAGLVWIACLPFLSAPDACAEIPSELVIGVTSVRATENLLRPTSEGDLLASRAVLSPVLRIVDASQGRVSLLLLDSYSVDGQSLSWKLRLKPALIFSNGQPIQGQDLCFSFNRCVDLLGHQNIYDQCSPQKMDSESAFEAVVVTASHRGEPSARQQHMLELFSQCPIIEARSSKLFKADVGVGANLVAAGEYRIRSFVENRSYTLERYQRSLTSRSMPQQTLEIRAFNHQRDALSALRIGTISLHIGDLGEIEPQVRSDVTLRIGNCNGKSFVYRRGFRVDCMDGIDLARIEWDPSILENSASE